MPILNTLNLSVGYRKNKSCTTIISGLNLELKRGVLVALVGANGIGKSTLLRTLVGNQQPISGGININNQNITKISNKELSHLLSIVNTDRTQAGGLIVVGGFGTTTIYRFFGDTRQKRPKHCIGINAKCRNCTQGQTFSCRTFRRRKTKSYDSQSACTTDSYYYS